MPQKLSITKQFSLTTNFYVLKKNQLGIIIMKCYNSIHYLGLAPPFGDGQRWFTVSDEMRGCFCICIYNV